MSDATTFRARSSYVYAVMAWLLLPGIAWAESIGRSWSGVVGVLLLCGALGYGAYLLFAHPRVRLFDSGLEIRNPVSDHRIGWQDVESIDARYTMSVDVQGRTIHAWAAPAPGRYHTRTLHPEDVRHLRVNDGTLIPAGESPRAHSGVAVHMARVRYREFSGGEATLTTHTYHRERLVYLGAAIALAFLLLL